MAPIRAVRLTRHGDPLRIEEVELADPGEHEVVVEIHFAGINPVDRYIAEGRVAPDAPLPRTLGSEAAGRLGDGRPVLAVGGGLWAERAVVSRSNVVEIPEGVSVEHAAAMGVAGLTAWKCVHELADLGAGDRALVLGASGGVGSMIVSLARAAGATVWGQTGSADKQNFIAAQGADRVLVGDAAEISDALRNFEPTVVFDPLGGPFVAASFEALAPRGRHVSLGTSIAPDVQINMQVLYRKMLRVLGYGGMLLGDRERREGLERALAALREGSLKVQVDRVLPLDQVNEAFGLLVERGVSGKLLLRPVAG